MIEFVDAYKDFLRELWYWEWYKYLFTHTYIFFEGSYFRIISFLEHFWISFIFGSHFWWLVWEFIIPTFLKWVFYDVILSKIEFKDFKYIIYWNALAILVWWIFWDIFVHIYWEKIDPIRWF